MKKYAILVMATAFMFNVALIGQEVNKPNRQEKGKQEMGAKQHKMLTPQMRADKMAKELELTESETAKVKSLIEKQDAQRIKQMDEMEKIKNEFKAKVEKERKSQDVELEKVIGKEKFQKLVAKRAEMMDKRKEGMKRMGQRNDDGKERGRKNRPSVGTQE